MGKCKSATCISVPQSYNNTRGSIEHSWLHLTHSSIPLVYTSTTYASLPARTVSVGHYSQAGQGRTPRPRPIAASPIHSNTRIAQPTHGALPACVLGVAGQGKGPDMHGRCEERTHAYRGVTSELAIVDRTGRPELVEKGPAKLSPHDYGPRVSLGYPCYLWPAHGLVYASCMHGQDLPTASQAPLQPYSTLVYDLYDLPPAQSATTPSHIRIKDTATAKHAHSHINSLPRDLAMG
jgi:hypothetical protein